MYEKNGYQLHEELHRLVYVTIVGRACCTIGDGLAPPPAIPSYERTMGGEALQGRVRLIHSESFCSHTYSLHASSLPSHWCPCQSAYFSLNQSNHTPDSFHFQHMRGERDGGSLLPLICSPHLSEEPQHPHIYCVAASSVIAPSWFAQSHCCFYPSVSLLSSFSNITSQIQSTFFSQPWSELYQW